MTQFGDMIYEDGMAIGIEMVIALFDALPNEILAQKSGLTLAHEIGLKT